MGSADHYARAASECKSEFPESSAPPRSRQLKFAFAAFPKSIIDEPSLTAGEKLVIAKMISLARDGFIWAKDNTLAERFGVCVRLVKRVVAKLVSLGLASKRKGDPRNPRRLLILTWLNPGLTSNPAPSPKGTEVHEASDISCPLPEVPLPIVSFEQEKGIKSGCAGEAAAADSTQVSPPREEKRAFEEKNSPLTPEQAARIEEAAGVVKGTDHTLAPKAKSEAKKHGFLRIIGALDKMATFAMEETIRLPSRLFFKVLNEDFIPFPEPPDPAEVKAEEERSREARIATWDDEIQF